MTLSLQLLAIVSTILAYILLSNVAMKVIWRLLKVQRGSNFYMELFYNVLLFTLCFVTIVALVATKGKTIFTLVPVILYFYFRSMRKNGTEKINVLQPGKSAGFSWLMVSVITMLTVTVSFFIILKFSIRNDVAFYAKITECLIPQGIENPFHHYNMENPVFKGNVPYHYFEMWFGGLCFEVANIFGIKMLSNYLIYIFFVFNLFRVLVIIGIFGIITGYVQFGCVHYIVVFLLLIIDVSAYCNWGNDSYVAESNFFERPNFIFYYLFLIPIFHAILNDNKELLVLWSAVFIIGTVTALPAVAGSIFLYFGYEWFKNRSLRKEIAIQMAFFVAFLICFGTFYKVWGVSKEASLVEAMSIGQIVAKTLAIWKACIFMFGMLFFKVAIIILASVIIIGRTFPTIGNQQFMKLHVFTLLICLCGIGVFQLIPYLDNMYQFAFIGYCAAVLMIMIVLAIKLQNIKGAKLYIGLSLFLVIIFYGYKRNLFFDHILVVKPKWNESIRTNFLLQNNLSREYIEEIQKLSDYVAANKGASLIDGKDALDEFLGLRHSMTFQLGNYLMAVNNKMHLPLLSDPTTLYPDPDKKSKDYYKAITFNKKTSFYKDYKDEISYKTNLVNYIKENRISYVVASKHLDPYSYLDSSMVKNIIKDSNKGHQFIQLNSAQ